MVVVAMTTLTHLHAQEDPRIKISLSAAYPDNNGDRLHKIANDFANAVGDSLKENFPMMIEPTTLIVTMECYNDTVKLSYTVFLIKCDTNQADYFFDRRGALSKDIRSYVAIDDAENRCADQALVVCRGFKKKYSEIAYQSYVDVNVKCDGYTYALSEYFLTARRVQ